MGVTIDATSRIKELTYLGTVDELMHGKPYFLTFSEKGFNIYDANEGEIQPFKFTIVNSNNLSPTNITGKGSIVAQNHLLDYFEQLGFIPTKESIKDLKLKDYEILEKDSLTIIYTCKKPRKASVDLNHSLIANNTACSAGNPHQY